MAGVDAGVQDRDLDAGALRGVPGLRRVDAHQVPLAAHVGVVGRHRGRHPHVQLGRLELRMPRQHHRHRGLRGIGRQVDDGDLRAADAARLAAVRTEDLGQRLVVQARPRLHQQPLARPAVGRAGRGRRQLELRLRAAGPDAQRLRERVEGIGLAPAQARQHAAVDGQGDAGVAFAEHQGAGLVGRLPGRQVEPVAEQAADQRVADLVVVAVLAVDAGAAEHHQVVDAQLVDAAGERVAHGGAQVGVAPQALRRRQLVAQLLRTRGRARRCRSRRGRGGGKDEGCKHGHGGLLRPERRSPACGAVPAELVVVPLTAAGASARARSVSRSKARARTASGDGD